jgi:glycosyltransferase involved in cell wall biosynthesis
MLMPSFYPVVGGMETQVERLIPFLREQGIDASVVTRKPTGTPRRETHQTIEVERIPILGGPGLRSISFTARGTAHVVRQRGRFDVFHAHSIMSPTTIAALSGLTTRTPRVVTLHATFEPERLLSKPFGATRLRLYSRVIDCFVAISDDIETLLLQHGMNPDRIARIPNGIDVERFQPPSPQQRDDLRRALDLSPEVPIALFAGRLHEVKQVDVLLRAWAAVEHGRLVIVGDGDERENLESLSAELELGERVTFRGLVKNVEDYLRAADVFVLPSRSEGLSVALLEAMASGCVPVATAVGGAVGLIHDGCNGRLIPPGNVHSLSAALERALGDRAWREGAATAARRTVESQYDMRVVARDLAALYRAITSSRD